MGPSSHRGRYIDGEGSLGSWVPVSSLPMLPITSSPATLLATGTGHADVSGIPFRLPERQPRKCNSHEGENY